MGNFVLLYADKRYRRRCFAGPRAERVVLADVDLEAADERVFDAVLRMPWPLQIREAVLRLTDWAATHPVEAILAESEVALLPGALASERLGLPHIGLPAALAVTDKGTGRQRLLDAGVPVPAFALARTADDVRRFARRHGYPVVLKALASCMARGVQLVRSPGDVDLALATLYAFLPDAPDVQRLLSFCELSGLSPCADPLAVVLVEEYVAGEQVQVDGLVLDGEPQVFGVVELSLSPPPLFFVEGYAFPSDRSEAEALAIERTAVAAARALGLCDAGLCVELRLCDGRPVVIEVNGRLGQDDGLGELFERVLGASPLRLWQQALATGRAPSTRPTGSAAVAYACQYRGGVVSELPAPPDEGEIVVARGERLLPVGDVNCFPHLAWALREHPSSSRRALAAAREAVDALRFRIEPSAPVAVAR